MQLIRRHGQTIGEYAILLGIVLGAIFAVQNHVRSRIALRLQKETDTYKLAAQGQAATIGDFTTGSESKSRTQTAFTTPMVGTVTLSSSGTSTITNPPD